MSPDGVLPEIVELPDHPWFIGVQFHPELKSKPFEPHPLFTSFVKAALDQSPAGVSDVFTMTRPRHVHRIGRRHSDRQRSAVVFIAGPNTLEARAHALEMSAALAEIAGKLGIGLIYKTSFDKANRTSIGGARGIGLRSRPADPRRGARDTRAARC